MSTEDNKKKIQWVNYYDVIQKNFLSEASGEV